ncbi:putative D,D-dipeptide transport ATP-binding protein DdpD [Granulosicoccus antarcticus IMCC3135]|uniref:Putative D,D-dipeptide transport ATP-binding protein DdpD n=2 Tax=Granulosicoccus TaxID=437504 RepID=A0A2Z2NW93_9GAMM|nr:putative D,D-dipeptide transport ATP-binding protein DdpD [Granulosicoccus antarcticus IMCC3135]
MFDGQELVGASAESLRQLRGNRIAYVAQSAAAAFNPAYKLINQYCEGPVRHGVMSRSEARSDAVDLYRKMQLPNPEEIGFRYPHQVSGGQLQRAMTAMSMACRPDLIIFDEPSFLNLGANASYLTAQSHGLMTYSVGMGDEVRAGQELGVLRTLHRLDAEPEVLRAASDGIVAILRTAPLVVPGDHLLVLCPSLTDAELDDLIAKAERDVSGKTVQD